MYPNHFQKINSEGNPTKIKWLHELASPPTDQSLLDGGTLSKALLLTQ